MGYRTEYIEARNLLKLTVAMNAFYRQNDLISLRDVSYLVEMRPNQLSPQQPVIVYLAAITYKLADPSV